MSLSSLQCILQPADADHFLSNVYQHEMLHVPSDSEKFAALFSWQELNRMLRNQDLRYPRMRLQIANKAVARDQYLNEEFGQPSPLALSVSKLNHQLREGATLIINAVDLLHEPLAILVDELSRVFRTRVAANLYAGWRTSPASGIHRDDHGVIILQIDGKKHWRVYRNTEDLTVSAQDRTTANQPPLWDGFLNAGDILYIPREWPHVAIPCDEPTLHLTLSLFEYNAFNLLDWLATTRLKSSPAMRRCIPYLRGTIASQEGAAYLAELQTEITKALAEPSLLESFLEDNTWLVGDKARRFSGKASTKPLYGLPWSAMCHPLAGFKDNDTMLHMASPLGFEMATRDDRWIDISFDEQTFSFDWALLPVLAGFQTSLPISVADCFARWEPVVGRESLDALLNQLLANGILVLRPKQKSFLREEAYSIRS